MITTGVVADAPKTCDELWTSIQKAFWALDENSMDNLCHQKTVACVQIAAKNGGHVGNDKHTGYRAAKNKLTGNAKVPTWIQMRDLCIQNEKWIYEFEVEGQ